MHIYLASLDPVWHARSICLTAINVELTGQLIGSHRWLMASRVDVDCQSIGGRRILGSRSRINNNIGPSLWSKTGPKSKYDPKTAGGYWFESPGFDVSATLIVSVYKSIKQFTFEEHLKQYLFTLTYTIQKQNAHFIEPASRFAGTNLIMKNLEKHNKETNLAANNSRVRPRVAIWWKNWDGVATANWHPIPVFSTRALALLLTTTTRMPTYHDDRLKIAVIPWLQ